MYIRRRNINDIYHIFKNNSDVIIHSLCGKSSTIPQLLEKVELGMSISKDKLCDACVSTYLIHMEENNANLQRQR